MSEDDREAGGPRLYLLTPVLTDGAVFAPDLDAALAAAPAACVRIRAASADEAALRRIADALRETCHGRDVALVLTDHYRLVRPFGLDGVHIENPRLGLRDARKALGADAIVGVFGGASRHNAMNLAEAGADYVSLGPVADTGLGDGAVADEDLFRWWSEMIETPVVAEGGVTVAAAARLAASADFIAVDAAVWEHPEGAAAGARAMAAAIG